MTGTAMETTQSAAMVALDSVRPDDFAKPTVRKAAMIIRTQGIN
jgi:hypothetical protein